MWRRTRAFAVLAAAFTLVATSVVPAQATGPSSAAERSTAHDVSVRWTGEAGFLTVQGETLGNVTVVPGDAGEAILRVRNDGPSDGSLTATVTNAAFRGADAADEFFRDLRINDVPAADLANGDHVFFTADLAQGATAEVPLSYEFPAEATSGNRGEVGERELAFDVQLRITGDTPDGEATWGATADTGGTAVPSTAWLLVLAGVLVVVAVTAARALRRPSSREVE